MRVIRYADESGQPVLAAVTGQNKVYPLPFNNLLEAAELANRQESSLLSFLNSAVSQVIPLVQAPEDLRLLVPIEAPEVWASGVTYERSRDARNYESNGGRSDVLTCYDKVYDADRPELFIKSTRARTVGPGDELCIRSDSHWQIPEPELGLVIDGKGNILGYTVGNDMSSRDIEGENPLYLPQAKIWKKSCSIGPAILLTEAVENPYDFQITCRIYREGEQVYEGTANTSQLKRKLPELVSYLIRDNDIFAGTVLLTGTCIVPPNDFTLRDGDEIAIEISDIGILRNPVKQL